MKLSQRLLHNRFLIIKALETLMFGAFMLFHQFRFNNNAVDINRSKGLYFIFTHAQDMGLIVGLFLIGIFGLYVGISKHSIPVGKAVFVISNATIWGAYFGVFLMRDITIFGRQTFEMGMIGFMCVSIIIEALTEDYI